MSDNLASKYRPSTFDDVTEQKVVVDIVKNICNSKELSNRNFLFTGSAGCGKALTLDSKVLTPDGFKEMRFIEAGDLVITRYGDTAEVTDVFPQGVRPIYEITLSDNSKIKVSDNHLNVVYRMREGRKEEYVLETTELIDRLNEVQGGLEYAIDTPIVRRFKKDEPKLPINPYLLGVLLASGGYESSKGLRLCIPNDIDLQVIADIENILKHDYGVAELKFHHDAVSADTDFKVYEVIPGDWDIDDNLYCHGLHKLLDSLNSLDIDLSLSSNRRAFPEIYLLSDLHDRYRLIAGFLSVQLSDERCLSGMKFRTSSTVESDNMAFLFKSCGMIDKVTVTDKEGELCYEHSIRIKDMACFYHTCLDDTTIIDTIEGDDARYIMSIKRVEDDECQCIYVNDPDHTFIADDFIPTHNTTLARIIANELNEGLGEPIEIDAASYNGAEAMREIVDQARSYPVGCNYKVFIIDEAHCLSPQAWSVMLKPIESQPAKTIFMLATTNPEKIPDTIISRVQSFQLSKISLEGIFNRLKHIIECENKENEDQITYDEEALYFIAKTAQGGMRDAITLLEKSLAYSHNITLEVLQDSLGLPNFDKYFDLLNAIAQKKNSEIVAIINEVYNSGLNFVKWFEGFFGFVTNIVKYIYLKDINQTTIPSTYKSKIEGYSTKHSAICLRLANVLVKMNQELKTTQYLQETAIAYLCAAPTK